MKMMKKQDGRRSKEGGGGDDVDDIYHNIMMDAMVHMILAGEHPILSWR
jgi:hypothetical protein